MNEDNPYNDGLPEELAKPKLNSLVVWFLIALPLGIAIGVAVGVYRHQNIEEQQAHKASVAVSSEEISQIVENYTVHIGSRGFDSEQELNNLAIAAKNIAGELQSSNSMMLSYNDKGGYRSNERSWKTYWADVKGSSPKKVFCVVTSYDGKQSLRNAAKLATLITLGKSLASQELDYTLRLVFVPKEQSLIEQESWVRKQCFKRSEKCLGMFFIGHGEWTKEKKQVGEDSWSSMEGDELWAQELMKGSRVMSYGSAFLFHGVFKKDQKAKAGDEKRVELAVKGLREMMIMILGGDR